MLGVAWPAMRVALDAPLAGLGILVAAWTAAHFVATAATGTLAGLLGTSRLASLAAFTAAIGLILLASVASWPQAIIAALFIGLGTAGLDASINTHVALAGGVRSMGVLHASWAVGAATGPATVGLAEALASWRAAYVGAALAFVAIALLLNLLRPERIATTATPQGEGRAIPDASVNVLLGAAMFFFYVGLETAAGQWAYVDLTIERGLSGIIAGWGVSLFFAALAAGRVLLGVGGHRISPQRELDASVALALAGAAGYWLLPPEIAALVALPLLGLGLSVFIPVLIAFTPARVGVATTASAVGVQFAAGTIGGGAFPPAIGLAMQSLAVPVLGPAATLLAGALVALHTASRSRASRSATAGW